MPPKLSHEKRWIKKAFIQVKVAETTHELRMGLSILLLNHLHLDLRQAGEIIGKTGASVSRYRREFLQKAQGVKLPRSQWGGRRRENLTPQNEAQLLLRFEQKAESGQRVTASTIQTHYEKIVGRKVPLSTVTRMMKRHGWRKFTPESPHPPRESRKEKSLKQKISLKGSRKLDEGET